MIKITYDKSVDAAYIYFLEPGTPVEKTYICNPSEVNGMINLDFDKEGKLIGVEVIDASKKLPNAILQKENNPNFLGN